MTTYTIYSGTSDGYVSTSASTYAGANSGTGAVADSSSSTILLIGQSVSIAPNYSCYQSFLEFDTSTVVGGVKTATLTMTPIDVSGNVTFFQINVSDYDWGGTVDTGDFRSPAQLSAFTLRATLDTTSASVDTAIDFLSQGSFGSIINTSGFTRLIAYSSNNSTATTPGSNEYVQFYPADQTGTTKDPKLVVSTPTANDWYFVGISNLVAVASGNLALVETGISGLQSGDLMVACIGARSTTAFTAPASWNTVGTPQVSGNTTVNTTSSIASGRMDWIIRGGSAPALTWNRTGGDLGLGRIVAYRNIGTITLDQHSEVTLGTANTAMANSGVTTSQAHELCVAMNVGARTATTWSAMDADTNPAGASGATDTTTGYIDVNFGEDQWTERSDDASASGADGSLEICDAVKSTAGATGTFRATASLSARNVQIVAIFKATSSVSNNKTLNVSMSRSISVLRAITKRNLVSVSSLVTVSRAIGHIINEQLASIAVLYRSTAHKINVQQANAVSLAKVATKNALLQLQFLTSVTESGTKINGPSNQVVSNVAIGSAASVLKRYGKAATIQQSNLTSIIATSAVNLLYSSFGSLNVSLNKNVSKTISVTLQSSVAFLRYVSKKITSSLASATSLLYLKAGGKLISATLGSATTMLRSNNKNTTIVFGNAVTLRRSISHFITSQLSSLTTVIKSARKPISIQQANVLTMVRSVGKRLPISQASLTTLPRNMSRAVNITIASVTTFRRSTGHFVSTQLAVLTTIIKSARKPFSIQLGNTTTLSRSAGKRVTMQLSSIVSMQRNLTKIISLGISHIVNDVRSIAHAINIQISPVLTFFAGANLPIQYFQTINVQQGINVSTTRLKIHFYQIINVFMGKSLIWNENDRSTADTTTISSDDLTYGPPFAGGAIRGNIGLKKKAYFEGIFYSVGSGQTDSQPALGVATSAKSADNLFAHFKPGNQIGENNVVSISVQVQTWFVNTNGSSTTVTIADLSGQTFGIALDYEAGEVRFVINGNWVGGGGSFGGATAFPIVTSGLDIYPFIGYYNDSPSYFTLTPKDGYLYMPSGYAPWQSQAMAVSVTASTAHIQLINVFQSISETLRNSITKITNVTIAPVAQLFANPSRFKNILVQLGSAVSVVPQSARGKLLTVTQASATSLRRSVSKFANIAIGSVISVRRSIAKFINVQVSSVVSAIKRANRFITVQISSAVAANPLRAYLRTITTQLSSGVSVMRSNSKFVNVLISSAVALRRSIRHIVSAQLSSVVSIVSRNIRSKIINITQSTFVSVSSNLAKTIYGYVGSAIDLIRRLIRDTSGATEPALIRSGNNVFLVTVTGHDGSGVETLRFATEGISTKPSDTPANTYFDPRVIDPGNFERHLRVRGVQGGSVGAGDVLLASGSPGRGGETLDYLLDWAFDGYTITIQSLTSIRQAVSLATTLFVGTIEQLLTEDAYNKIGFKIHDRLSDLDHPFLTNTYAGTTVTGGDGTANGNTDLKGNKKQKVFGTVYNVVPQVSNPFDLILDFSDGPVSSITLYDGALALTNDGDVANLAALLAWTQVPGHYKTCLALGKVVAGGLAVFGWQADVVEGVDSPPGQRTAAQILLRMFDSYGIDSSELELSTFTLLDFANSAECGILIKDDETFLSAAQRLLDGPGADVLPTSMGKFGVWYFSSPSTSPDVSVVMLEEDTIIGSSLQRISTEASGRGVPVYRVTMRYAHNESVLSTTQIAGAVSDDRRTFVSSEWRSVVAEDLSVLDRHLKAIEVSFDTCFVSSADAAAEAARHLALFSVRRDAYRVKAMLDYANAATIGTVVTLKAPRFGLDNGQKFIVIGRVDDYENKTVELDLWGGID